MLRVHITGVGDAFTERYHNASLCLEEPRHGFRLMIDCPPAFPRVLADHRRQAGSDLSVDNIDHLLLTHLHGDHCGGTEAYLYLRRFVVGRLPTLWGAPEVLDELWPTRLRGGMEQLLLSPQIDREARSTTVKGGPRVQLTLTDYTHRGDLLAERTRIGPLIIERRFTIHHIPTTAIRVTLEGQDRPCLGYSADTAFDPDLIEWLAQADLIIHETNYGVHTPLDKLAGLPVALRERMRLIHYPDQLDVETAPIRALRQGEILDLPGALGAPATGRAQPPAPPPDPPSPGPDPLASPALARILDHVAHPIFIKDRSFRFALVNQALADMVRIPRAELLGKSDYDFFPQAEADFFRRKDEQVFSGGAVVVIEEEQITDAGGQVHVLSTTKVPLVDEAGQVTYMVGITHDISPLKRVEEDLRRANRELGVALGALQQSNTRLHELDRLKSELLANVSHEFRTPLTLNLAPLEEMLAEERNRTGPDHDRLQHVYRNSLRLLHLVNNLLDFSRLESGRADAAFEPIAVSPLTGQLAGAFAAAFAKKGLGFRFVADVPDEQIAFLDPQLWEKIVFNLLSNALKFTERGEVLVTLSLISGVAGGGGDLQRLRLEVADTGIGIPLRDRVAVFERFHRAHPSGSQGGTGIGLALVAEAVRLHGGTVELAEGQKAPGSRFIVELPLGSAHLRQDQLRQRSPRLSPPPSVRTPELGWSAPAMQDTAHADAQKAPAGLDAPLILIIDDNSEMRTYLGALLCGLGRILIAADGQAGLRLLRERRPDLVLADVMMPIIDGFELCRLVREDPGLCEVPIMLLTARAELASRVQGLRSGADDYVLKPFSPEELLARARLQLNLRTARQQLQAHAHHLEQLLNDKIGELRRRHAELHTIVGNLGEGVLVFDSAGRLTLVNMAATALTGLPVAQGSSDPGGTVESVIRDVPLCDGEGHLVGDGPEHPLRRASVGETIRDMEVRLAPRGDQGQCPPLDLWVLLCATPLPDGAGVVCTLHDIRRLKEAERLKDEFLSVASHELRTPLSSLQLLAGVFRAQVKGQPYAEPLLPLLDRQQRLIHRLGRLIADILDVSRLQLGRMSVQKRPLGLMPLLRDAIERARGTFGARHTIVLHMQHEVCVRADPDRLDQVLSNLLANACKYAPAGTEIAVDIAADGTEGTDEVQAGNTPREVQISVSDRGPGIPREMQGRVFERFYQVEAASGRAFGGLGLGLYISRELVIAHGGRLWVESEPGQGCVFRFTLPME